MSRAAIGWGQCCRVRSLITVVAIVMLWVPFCWNRWCLLLTDSFMMHGTHGQRQRNPSSKGHLRASHNIRDVACSYTPTFTVAIRQRPGVVILFFFLIINKKIYTNRHSVSKSVIGMCLCHSPTAVMWWNLDAWNRIFRRIHLPICFTKLVNAINCMYDIKYVVYYRVIVHYWDYFTWQMSF